MSEPQRVGEIVEAGIGSLAYLALHVSEVQAGAAELAEKLDGRVPEEFRDLLSRVAAYEVRLSTTGVPCPECKGKGTRDYGMADSMGGPLHEWCDTCGGTGIAGLGHLGQRITRNSGDGGMKQRVQAAWHEVRCSQCRVTWRSWWQRLRGKPEGMTPRV